MSKTISFHNGSVWSRGHNIRDERYTSKLDHIDKELSEQNIVLKDMPVREAYAELFGKAVEDYNAKQKRSDRRIEDYYEKIKKDKTKHPVYECIVQIGDRSDTGNAAELEKQALIEYAQDWDRRNPNLYLIGAYIHCDEPDGTVHLHLDYIPVAECKRGMSLQNSLVNALNQQGFEFQNVHNTAQVAWQHSEREALRAICQKLNIDAQHNQGIGKGREYLTPDEYKKAKKEQQNQINEELQPLKNELQNYKELKVNTKTIVIDEKKIPLSHRVSVPTDELEVLKEQAMTFRTNRFEIETLRQRKIELDERERQLDAREAELKKNNEVVLKNYKTVEKMYNRQKNLNSVAEEAEKKIASLTHENNSLTASLKDSHIEIQSLKESLQSTTETLRGAYESVANIVEAVGMLKYDKENGYGVELTQKQGVLIDAIAKYGARWANTDGFPDLAKSMEKNIGISLGIQDDIQALTQTIVPVRTK